MKIYNLEPTDMGNDQQEIADKVMSYVEDVEFACADEFHKQEGTLIQRACDDMGWVSAPQNGGLIVEWEENPDIPDLAEFMQEYELETYQQVIDVLEDGEVLGTLPLVQNQVEELWFEASGAVRVIGEALSFILREIHTANKLRGEDNAIANDSDNEVLLTIFHNAMNKFPIEIVDDADALADLFGLVGLDAIRDAEAGIGGAS